MFYSLVPIPLSRRGRSTFNKPKRCRAALATALLQSSDSALDSPVETAKKSVMHRLSSAFLALSLSTVACLSAERKVTITVAAGDFARRDTMVTFPVPADFAGYPSAMPANSRDTRLSIQINGTNAAFFPLPLEKGAQASYVLLKEPPVPEQFLSIRAAREGKKLTFSRTDVVSRAVNLGFASPPEVKSKPLFAYQAEPSEFPRANIKELFRRGAYLHPIHTWSGQVITDDFPPNHIHHHGIWWSWTNTEFDGRKPDFWNMGDGKGRIDFVALDAHWSGMVHAGFRSRHDYVDLTAPKPVVALHETWDVRAFGNFGQGPGPWQLDMVCEQRCATTHALKLPQNRYGGIGLRGNWAWNGATNVNFLTSDGVTDRIKGHEQRARWCDMWGMLNGQAAGIAVLGHPSNFRFPEPMRIHPTEPFFNFAPQQAGDMGIKPGETYVTRYRFVIHDGEMTKAELDRLWNDYAHPPVVKVKVE